MTIKHPGPGNQKWWIAQKLPFLIGKIWENHKPMDFGVCDVQTNLYSRATSTETFLESSVLFRWTIFVGKNFKPSGCLNQQLLYGELNQPWNKCSLQWVSTGETARFEQDEDVVLWKIGSQHDHSLCVLYYHVVLAVYQCIIKASKHQELLEVLTLSSSNGNSEGRNRTTPTVCFTQKMQKFWGCHDSTP